MLRTPRTHSLRAALVGSVLLAAAACQVESSDDLAQAASGTGRYIVRYHNSNGRGAAVAAANRVHHDFAGRRAVAVSLPAQAAAALANNPNIEYVEEDAIRRPSADTTPYGISMVQAAGFGLSDAAAGNRTVCIIDSGYDLGHPDLPDSNVTGSPGSNSPLTDTCGHGSHVAGTIAAVQNNTGVVGVLPGETVNLHIVKVFDGVDCGWSYSSDLVAALNECEAAGANVVSMSLGGGAASRFEGNAFAGADGRGVLSIAAAGNDGNTRKSYPASYPSVVSVAAIDSNKAIASFSQQNDAVDLAAPGVGVLSTVPVGTGATASVAVGATTYDASAMDGSPDGNASGALVDCDLGGTTCPGATGKVCLIERGTFTFAEKVQACEDGGGVAAIIYNNAPGDFGGTLGGVATGIPSVGVSGEAGTDLLNKLGQTATVDVNLGADHAKYDGTSMATPHVSGVAALVWSMFPTCSNAEIRAALEATAEDLGAAGRDNAYGHGLVRAKNATDYLAANGCTGGGGGGGGGGGTCELGQPGDSCTSGSECCSGNCKGKPGRKTCK